MSIGSDYYDNLYPRQHVGLQLTRFCKGNRELNQKCDLFTDFLRSNRRSLLKLRCLLKTRQTELQIKVTTHENTIFIDFTSCLQDWSPRKKNIHVTSIHKRFNSRSYSISWTWYPSAHANWLNRKCLLWIKIEKAKINFFVSIIKQQKNKFKSFWGGPVAILNHPPQTFLFHFSFLLSFAKRNNKKINQRKAKREKKLPNLNML